MLPYLLVISFIVFWVILEEKSLNRKSVWLPLIVLSLFAGMRSFVVGTDSETYTRKFTSQLDVSYFVFKDGTEIGYQFLEYSLLRLTDNYFWLFFTTALIIVYCYLKIIRKYSENYWLSVFLFLTLGVYTFFFNGLRQGLAMAIFALGTPYLLEKRVIPYVLICLFASLFHTTALFMIPFYFLVNLKFRVFYKILLTFLGSLLISGSLVSYLSSFNERYESYGAVSEAAGGLLILGFYTIILIFIYIIGQVYKIREENFLKLYTLYATGVVFIIPLALLGRNPSGPQRLITYFTWLLVLLLPTVLKRINSIYITALTVIFVLFYFILTTSKFSNLTPYIINPIFEMF